MDLRKLIQEYLASAQVMQVATVHDNKPWIATVYYVADADLNLYWISKGMRRHSRELEENSKVAGSVVVNHVYGEKVRGLQVEGVAEQLKGNDAEQGINVYKSRFWIVEEREKALAGENEPAFVYRLKPERYVLIDEVNLPDNPRQELKM